jgi:hypothetical protein
MQAIPQLSTATLDCAGPTGNVASRTLLPIPESARPGVSEPGTNEVRPLRAGLMGGSGS